MRAIYSGLGVKGGVVCEWTGTTKGCIDFYIKATGWAVELLREGTPASISEHTSRFTCGQYQDWVEDGSISDWLVVDCRTSIPHDTCG